MVPEPTINILVDKLADESRRQRNSAIVFGALGVIAQILIIVGAGLSKKAEIAGFIFLSLIFSWSLLIIAAFYLRKSRKLAARPANALWRALTSEPQNINEIILEIPPHETPAQKAAETSDYQRQNLIGNILDSVFDSNSTPDYAVNLTSSMQLKPAISISLTNGEKHQI